MKERKQRKMKNIIKELRRKDHPHVLGALDIFKYIGPGLLVTVGLSTRETGQVTLPRGRNMATLCFGW